MGRRLLGVDQTRARIVDLQAAEAMAKMGDYRQYDPIRAALSRRASNRKLLRLRAKWLERRTIVVREVT